MKGQIRKALLSTGYFQLRRLRFRVDQVKGVVVLNGTVESFHLKQLAQESIKNVIGGFKLLNRIEVKSDGTAS